MKSCFKKIIAVFAAFAIVASLSLATVFALDYEARPTSWWDSVVMKGISTDTDIPLFDYLLVTAGDVASGAVCAGSSPDKLHHGSVTAEGERGGIDKAGQAFVYCKCKYCGDMFKGYASDLSAAYDDYVETLPAQGYNSSGGLLWSPSHRFSEAGYVRGSNYRVRCEHGEGKSSGVVVDRFTYSFNCSSNFICLMPISGSRMFSYHGSMVYFGGSAPIDGYYSIVGGNPSVSGYYVDSDGVRHPVNENWADSTTSTFYTAGASVSASLRPGYTNISSIPSGSSYQLVAYQGIPPVYRITPVSSISSDTYNINTRPTSITGGNYGIVGDNGQITKVEDNSTIINETNNTFYNPATGTTVPIVNWSYDYSDRSYKVTLESGDTATITYGDENITISQITTTEGDTITNNYTIYYLVDGSGSENPPSTCVHDWQETNTTPATCTVPGSKLSTCSKCQQTKKDPLPALGHDWQVKQTVTTEYDDTGQLTQEGYTIFECSRCHEQYKSSDGTIPPGGGSGTDPGGDEGETIWDKLGNLVGAIGSGVIGLIEAALGKVLDALIALVEGMMERLKTVVEAVLSIFDELPKLFGGFLDFLVAVFPFLPPELMTILTFGILAVVFIGIIKAVRR